MSYSEKDILESEVQEVEELLWSHVISQKNQIETPLYVSGIWRFAQPIIFSIYVFFIIYGLKNIPSEQLGDMVKSQLPMWIVFGVSLWVLIKTIIGKKLKEQTERPIFQNGIITDKRILLFNHSEARQEFSLNDIKEAGLDYENGGHALRIDPLSKEKPSILVGIADFKSGLNIINCSER